ncbi:MAG: sugar ABC transporter permease [Bdellovibrionales bacterium]|nr:sugar ABC transporter permease [Bdellovibrionales bacterium]
MRRIDWLPWLLLSPTVLLLAIFVVYPALYSIYLSTQNVDPFTHRTIFVGWENYLELAESAEYWKSLKVSLLFTLYTVIPSIVVSLAVALALNAKPYINGFFRTLFLMPVAVSSAMAAMLWIFLYNPTAGFLNYVLSTAGVVGPNWLADPTWSLVAVAIATVWKELGFNVIFFLAGLASVPPELNEAARIDGANAWQRFWRVTLPMLSPTVFFVGVVSVIHSFESFGQIHILTRGGPAGATNVLVYSLYRDAFENFRSGFASAQAVILFAIILAATFVQFRIGQKRVHYA